jgi:ribosomal-protein-alanine N-acetyltransferase
VGHGRLKITAMRPEDIQAVHELEAGILSAWSREHLEEELKQPSGFQLVALNEITEKVLAVLCGRIMADEAEILKLSVAEYARKKGVGYQLLEFALSYCKKKGAQKCYLELRASNKAARNLYEKRGFSKVGTRKNYYARPAEDAIMMQLAF